MEQVMCIDDRLPKRGFWSGDPVIKNEIYTIKASNDVGHDDRGWLLEEVRGGTSHSGREKGYRADRFVPINDKSIEIFREMDRKIFKRKKQDA